MSEPPAEATEISSQKDSESLKDLWVPIDVEWLHEYYSRVLRQNERVREHHPSAVSPMAAEGERTVQPGHFLLATGSTEKKRLILDLVQAQGGSVQPAEFIGDQWQSDAHEEARRYKDRSFYPLTVAEGKLNLIRFQMFENGKTAIATDIVVAGPKGRIIEKPKGVNDLVKMLRSVRGQRIRVMVGVCALVPLREGIFAPGLSEGAEIAFKIKDLTDDEVSDSVGKLQEKAKEFAGGVDFSSEFGQGLIDKSFPITVSPFESTIYQRFCEDRGVIREPVTIGPQNIGVLEDYFKGVPKDIIAVLMRQARELQERVEKI